jgi:nucleoside-diphosphate-sugar epimerase
MKILLAGASGAIGTPLTRLLVGRGHEVLGLTRDPGSASAVRANGATPVVADALDRDALLKAVDGVSADAVIHELTALKKAPTRHRGMELTDRLRNEGTTNLVAAAEVIGASRFVTQSIILGYGYRDHGDRVLDEDAPFGRPAGDKNDPHLAAMASAEQQAFATGDGVALRYGMLYGGDASGMAALLARRGVPVADGGLLGWVHLDDAAEATVAALERGEAGAAYDIVDDQPASWRDVFTAMAAALGAPAPRHLPRWLFRLVAPYVATFAVDTSMRVSNARARRDLGWAPVFRTCVEGIDAMSRSVFGDERGAPAVATAR